MLKVSRIWIWGALLLASLNAAGAGDGKGAKARLAEYMKTAGREGEHYRDALKLYVESDTVMAKGIAASKDSPWENSLGMRFVPVPGTDVLFSVWETRVQDYAAYARVNSGVNADWSNPKFKDVPVTPGPEHPVVNVSWDDAQAFCKWLTVMERQNGRIAAGAHYRIPTDEEWSRAVGLPRESGSTPKARGGGVNGVYPWGNQWPPPRGSGNYSDATAKAKLALTGIDGYQDGYPTTSPAGSFPANKYGLYDMGGNVWEWCEDWYDPTTGKSRVLRGASWADRLPGILLSSCRNDYAPSLRSDDCGFRVVLESVSSR